MVKNKCVIVEIPLFETVSNIALGYTFYCARLNRISDIGDVNLFVICPLYPLIAINVALNNVG